MSATEQGRAPERAGLVLLALILVAAIGASLLSTLIFLFSLPPGPRISKCSSLLQKGKAWLSVLPDYMLFLLIC